MRREIATVIATRSVHHEFQLPTIAVAVSANPDFALSHVAIVAISLP
jgi:hypothetical protein